ncbi:MAG: ABC transporter substrate-binding protein [Acidimicrobiales bacterium]
MPLPRPFAWTTMGVALLVAVGACSSGSATSSKSATGGNTSSSASSANGAVATNTDAVKAGGTMTVALAEDPDKLDPTLGRSLVGREVFANMCEKLYDVNDKLEIIPQLASALPKTSEDGKTVTIAMRSGLKFNDGTPLDAAAVKTSLDRHLTLAGSARKTEISPITEVTVVDPMTVQLTLSKPFAPLTAALADRAGMIMSPAALTKLGANFGTAPVCVGPFSFVSRTTGSEIVLQKAPDYYDAAKVKLDKVIFKIITDANVRVANLKSGDVAVAERLAPTDIPGLKTDPKVSLITATSIGYQGLTINVGNTAGVGKPVGKVSSPLGGSPQLRQAFADALDRDAINKVVFAGLYQPTCSPIPSASPYADKEPCPKRDVAAAKKLIADSGTPAPVTVSLLTGTSPEDLRLGQVIQSLEKEAGFDVQLKPTEFASLLDQTDAGKFDATILGWSGRVDPDGNIYNFLHTGGALNIGGLSDPAVDAPLEDARKTSDMAARAKDYATTLAAQAKDNALIYLYNSQLYLGTAKNVGGLDFFNDGLPRLKTAGFTGAPQG